MAEYTIGSLCAGVGGLDLAVEDVFDAAPAWFSQYEPGKDGKPDRNQYAAQVLAEHWPGVPNLGDLTAIDWATVPPVDILTAGFPCQPVSNAGRRLGEHDDRWIWPHIAGAVRVLRPRLVLLENVAALVGRGLARVLADLAAAGFDAEWACVRASDVGAAHRRERVFVLAWPASDPAHLGHEWPRQARGRRPRSAHRGLAAAHPDRVEPERRGGPGVLGGPPPTESREEGQRERAGHAAGHRGPAPADADDAGARPQPDREPHRPEADHEHQVLDAPGRVLGWGAYAPAIARWEHVMGRPAPAPTEPGKNGPRLAPRFVEWLVGLDAGWVTDTGIPRNAQLKCLGNIAMPHQAAHAIRHLMATATDLTVGDTP